MNRGCPVRRSPECCFIPQCWRRGRQKYCRRYPWFNSWYQYQYHFRDEDTQDNNTTRIEADIPMFTNVTNIKNMDEATLSRGRWVKRCIASVMDNHCHRCKWEGCPVRRDLGCCLHPICKRRRGRYCYENYLKEY